MENNKNNSGAALAKKMAVSLVCGLVAGFAFMMLREKLNASGNSALWKTINDLLFQDITAEGAEQAFGIFYIIGQLFIKALQLVIIPMVFTSISLAIGSISDTRTMGRIASKTLFWFLLSSFLALLLAGVVGYTTFSMGLFNAHIEGPGRGFRFYRFQPSECGAEHHSFQHHHGLWQQRRGAFFRFPGDSHRPEHECAGREPYRHHAPPDGGSERRGGRFPELRRHQVCTVCSLCAADPYLCHLRCGLPQAGAGLCGNHRDPAVRVPAGGLPYHRGGGRKAEPVHVHQEDRECGGLRFLHFFQCSHPAPEHQSLHRGHGRG